MPTPLRRDPPNKGEIDRLVMTLINDSRSKIFILLADEYVKAGMWREASAVLEEGLKVYPGFITAMVALGRAYDQLGQANKAKAILEEAVKLSPDNLRAHRILAKLHAADGAKDLAQRSCQVILSVSPQDEEALSITRALEQHTSATTATPIIPNPTSEPDPHTASVSQTTQLEEVQKEDVTPNNQPTEEPEKRARLQTWLKKIQAKRQATA